MKTISLIQPWASFMALGLKHIETRSWTTKYRGELLIHASKKIVPFHKILNYMTSGQRFMIMKNIWESYQDYNLMPTGMIIAKTILIDIQKIVKSNIYWAQLENGYMVDLTEWHLGDYAPGRFAWITKDTIELEAPIPAKGKLGLWEWEERG